MGLFRGADVPFSWIVDLQGLDLRFREGDGNQVTQEASAAPSSAKVTAIR